MRALTSLRCRRLPLLCCPCFKLSTTDRKTDIRRGQTASGTVTDFTKQIWRWKFILHQLVLWWWWAKSILFTSFSSWSNHQWALLHGHIWCFSSFIQGFPLISPRLYIQDIYYIIQMYYFTNLSFITFCSWNPPWIHPAGVPILLKSFEQHILKLWSRSKPRLDYVI